MTRLMTRRTVLLAVIGLLSAPTAALATVDQYSWHGDSFTLASGTRKSAVHYFDGNNIGIEMTCSANRQGTFVVGCYQSNGQKIGTRTFAYQGFTKATWPSAGPGYYYFLFSKVNDGAVVKSNDVATYSW